VRYTTFCNTYTHGPRTSPRLCPFSKKCLNTPALYYHITLWEQVAVSQLVIETRNSEIAKRESQSLLVHTAPLHVGVCDLGSAARVHCLCMSYCRYFYATVNSCLVSPGSVLPLSNGGLLLQF
jgi:hypothetical protein